MLSRVYSSATYGIDAYIVEVETNIEKQMTARNNIDSSESETKD